MKVLLLGVLAAVPSAAPRAPAPEAFPDLDQRAGAFPRELKVTGKPFAVARWTDKLGLNVAVLAETPHVETDGPDSQWLHGYHFVRQGTGPWKQLWKTTDGVSACEFDLTLDVRPRALSVTDLDRDGIAETGYAYVASCGSDVSPDPLKVILHEGDKKFALRGTTRVQVSADDNGKPQFEGGDRKPDPALAAAPPAFQAHAQKLFDQAGGKK
jgi:hypothetical protein